jgi:hypothetical protein
LLVASAGRNASASVSTLLVEVTPWLGPARTTVQLTADGRLQRWDHGSGQVQHAAAVAIPDAEVRRLLELAEAVPPPRPPSDTPPHGDIIRLARDGRMTVYVGGAPDLLSSLVTTALTASDAATPRPADAWIRVEPVDPLREQALERGGIESIPIADFAGPQRDALSRAAREPWAFLPVTADARDEIERRAGAAEFFVETEDSRWIQVGLWGRPAHPSSDSPGGTR